MMPNRHSVFWKLATLLVGFCLLMIWLSWSWGRYVDTRSAFLSHEARATLQTYAADAEKVWLAEDAEGLQVWLAELRQREAIFATVLDNDLQPLTDLPLSEPERERLTSLRGVDWPMSRRARHIPWLKVPFPNQPGVGDLIIELPQRFMPGRYLWAWRVLTNGVIPGLFTLLLCVGLYRMLVVPLNQLREQANAWQADQLGARLPVQTTSRSDELGELGRAFDQMSARLQGTIALQQQLLRDLSHELRTPLSRLRVAHESEQDGERLRQRLGREIDGMQRLVEDTLQLAWRDTERAPLVREPIQIQALWEFLAENASYESQWPATQLRCDLGADCWVVGHLDSLAQCIENVLRNAIRHSPADGIVALQGRREGENWLIWVQDQGGGVAEADVERIFEPFSRLDGSRPGDGGFGLGLSIARNAVRRQGGEVWAQNTGQGLRLYIRLPQFTPDAQAPLPGAGVVRLTVA